MFDTSKFDILLGNLMTHAKAKHVKRWEIYIHIHAAYDRELRTDLGYLNLLIRRFIQA